MKYVITVKPRNLQRYRDQLYISEDGNESWYSMFAGAEVVEETVSGDVYEDKHMLFADTEEQAKLAAKNLARKRPGRDVFVSQTCAVFSTAISNVVEKSVTDQGVLPL